MFPAERSEVKLRYGNRVTEQFSLEKTCPTRSSVLHSAGKAWKFLDPKTDGLPDIFVYKGGFIFLIFFTPTWGKWSNLTKKHSTGLKSASWLSLLYIHRFTYCLYGFPKLPPPRPRYCLGVGLEEPQHGFCYALPHPGGKTWRLTVDSVLLQNVIQRRFLCM